MSFFNRLKFFYVHFFNEFLLQLLFGLEMNVPLKKRCKYNRFFYENSEQQFSDEKTLWRLLKFFAKSVFAINLQFSLTNTIIKSSTSTNFTNKFPICFHNINPFTFFHSENYYPEKSPESESIFQYSITLNCLGKFYFHPRFNASHTHKKKEKFSLHGKNIVM